MATPDTLDFERLLQPISEEHAGGVELKEDESLRGVYQAVKDAREAARTAEKKMYRAAWLEDEGSGPVERPDWQRVHDLAVDAIAQHSKDLWITSWLIESLARLRGFAGLRDGFRLTRELVERFWEDIHPRPDEDGYATTVAQLAGLNGDESEGALIEPMDRIPFTDAGSIRPLSLADYREAVELDKLADTDKRAQKLAKGAISLELVDKAVRETSADFFQNLLEDLEQAMDQYFRLAESLDNRCGSTPDGYPAAPPTSAIRNALADLRDQIKQLAAPVIGAPTSDEEGAVAEGAGAPSGQAAGGGRPSMSREEAFRQLLQVADYFRRTEPHSPVSYALEQTVRWGRMSLPELLAELISDSGVRDDLFKRTGIARQESSE